MISILLLLAIAALVPLASIAAQLDWLRPEPPEPEQPEPDWLGQAYAVAPALAYHPAWQREEPAHVAARLVHDDIAAALHALAPRIAAERAARRPLMGQPIPALAGAMP